jgi:hypothetical protein
VATNAAQPLPSIDLRASLTAALGIEAGCKALLVHAQANVTAIRKQIKIADAAPKPAPDGRTAAAAGERCSHCPAMRTDK